MLLRVGGPVSQSFNFHFIPFHLSLNDFFHFCFQSAVLLFVAAFGLFQVNISLTLRGYVLNLTLDKTPFFRFVFTTCSNSWRFYSSNYPAMFSIYFTDKTGTIFLIGIYHVPA